MSYFKVLAKNSLVVLFTNFGSLALNFVTVGLTIRYLGLHDFGVYTLLLTIIGFAEQFATLGLYPLLVAEIARSRGKQKLGQVKTILYRYFQVQFCIGLFIAILFSLTAYFNFFKLDSLYLNAFYLFSLYMILISIENVMITFFEGHQGFHLSSRYLLVESFAKLVLIGGLMWFQYPPSISILVGVLLASILTGLLSILAPFISILKPYLHVPREKNNWFFQLLKSQGIYAWLTHLIKNLQLNAFPWFIKLFLGVEAVGIFSVLQKIQTTAMKVITPLDQTMLPLASEMQEMGELKTFFNRVSKYSAWIGVAMFIGVSVATPFFLSAYIGSESPGQDLALVILLTALPIYALLFPLRALLFRFSEQKFFTKLVAVDTIVLFGATLLLLPEFGFVGAAVSIVLMYLTDLLIRRNYVKAKYGINFHLETFLSFDSYDRVALQKLIENIKATLRTRTRG